MKHIKELAGQTMIYGMGTIIPRLLNYLILTPFFTRIFSKAEYGMFTELYSYVVFLLVLLTYGMETTFFRFTQSESNFKKLYSTTLISLFTTSVVFIIVSIILNQNIAEWINYTAHPEYIMLFCIIVSIDAFTSIPFAKLRFQNKAAKFGILKIANVSINILLNVFFYIGLPWLVTFDSFTFLNGIYNPEFGIGYAFTANLIASISTLIMLLPDIFVGKFSFDRELVRRMLKYAMPLLVVGLAGMINEVFDKIIMKYLVTDKSTAMESVGVYGANYKLAVLMTLFIQMFRYAAEPFFFSRMKDEDAKNVYADVMKYFVAFGLLIFLGVTLYMNIIQYFIGAEFREGVFIVPIILLANLSLGIIYNLSIWYKLTNKTKFGAYIALSGAAITIFLNVTLVPRIGYLGAAWAHLICNLFMMILSFILGRRFYHIPYEFGRIAIYFFIAMGIFALNVWLQFDSILLEMVVNTILIFVFILSFIKIEKISLKSLPFLKKS